MQVERFSPSLLNNQELPSAAERLIKIIANALPKEKIVQLLKTLITRDIDQMESALGRSRTSEFTERLNEIDELRDDAFVALRDFAKACSSRNNQAVADSGRLIYEIIRERGVSLHRLAYGQETTELKVLFENLTTPEAEQAITTIGATAWLQDLQLAQENFETAVEERDTASSQDDTPRLTPARHNLSHHLDNLLGTITVLREGAEVEGDQQQIEVLDSTISLANEIIGDVMSIARARRSREASRDGEPKVNAADDVATELSAAAT